MRYSTESTVLPTNAPALLNWAAAHVEARGFHDGRDGDRFGRNRGVTSTRLFTPGILGALDVAGGDGRRSSSRAYDYPALYAAQRLALDTLSDLVAGGAVVHDSDWPDEYRHRRHVVHQWGTQGDRTRADVVEVLREAAGLAESAATAAARPGRPMARIHRGSVGGVLAWAATHLEDVGHRPGLESHDPAGFAGSRRARHCTPWTGHSSQRSRTLRTAGRHGRRMGKRSLRGACLSSTSPGARWWLSMT